ncbi:unnamed protein product [Dicrocoelium dendriticum]|nr:unnamed protein product [Dicrocoelium dendriticum]
MDPASIFEDALKGLATKDSNECATPRLPKLEHIIAPQPLKQSALPASANNIITHPKRIPLLTDSPLLIDPPTATVHSNPSTDATEDPGGDIILNALINAGIPPSSLKTTSSIAPVTTTNALRPLSHPTTHLKVMNSKGSAVLTVFPNTKPNPDRTSQFIRRFGNSNGMVAPESPRTPSIIRKRYPSSGTPTLQPPSKIRRSVYTPPHAELNGARVSDSLFPSISTGPKRPDDWRDAARLHRGASFVRTYSNSHQPAHIIKPFHMLRRDDDLEEDEDFAQAETYAEYVPMRMKLGCKHPDPVVESSSLSSVLPPDVHYRLTLPREVIDGGHLSSLQLEAVVYACQRHECLLPNGQRAGFLIGDGAGVGKGRTIAGILYENYIQHRKKAIWLSVSNDLRVDAERDLRDVGFGKIKVHSLNKFKYARISGKANGRVKKGVIFSTYSSLIGESQGSAKAKYKTRLKQLVHWCGKSFDGVIVFDECHRAKNLTPSGSQKPTKTGLTVLELQNRLPNARIVYASATGATEPRNMAYMTRLGLWGEGTPFKTFNAFIQSLERRGVGAMELVAMDMKLRGMYIARQLSFQGVQFNIREITIEDVRLKNESFVDVYNQCADLWVYAYRFFSEATRLSCPSDRFRKTMWGQFWSAHQRFFKYLCIAAKLDACVELTKASLKDGNCVVIGLQSTGEAKTLEQVEELGSDLGDYVSTTKGVFQSLVEKYFPIPSNLENFSLRGERLATMGDRNSSATLSRAGRAVAGGQGSGLGLKDILGEKMFAKLVAGGSLSGSNADEVELDRLKSIGKNSDSDADNDDDRSDDSGDEDDSTENLSTCKTNGLGHSSSSDYFDSDLELYPSGTSERRRTAGKKAAPKKRERGGPSSNELSDNSDSDWDPDALFDSFLARQGSWSRGMTDQRFDKTKKPSSSLLDDFVGEDSMRELSHKYLFRKRTSQDGRSIGSSRDRVPENVSPDEARRQCSEMQSLLLRFIEKLGPKLPPSSLDELIDKLGGPSCVAEMTGRKGRMVMGDNGRVSYESRREFDVSLEIVNLTEKQRFMDGEKLIAVISEAASSGISLQADRRALNQRRRVHITLELPWSADRAIQQFGRTHRSNQVSAPKYLFLISDLAGEQRFASTVAKRLESLGALTHGDRRATDSRDLSQFNIDTKLGREALDIIMRSCIYGEEGIVEPPSNYASYETSLNDLKPPTLQDGARMFFVDAKASLQGVGLATGHTRERDANQMSKFLNRMLGLRVHVQNAIFRYFSDTLEELTRRAKRDNRLDLGIMDLGTSGQNLEITWTKSFDTWFLSESTKVHLHKVTAERGLSWAAAMEIYTQHDGVHDGFYLPSGLTTSKVVIPVLAVYVKSRPGARLSGGKSDTKYYRIYRPNTGMQARPLELGKLLERYTRVANPSECQDAWYHVCKESATRCIHVMQHGICPRATHQRTICEVGLRVRTYHVLSGSVLNVWAQIEPLIQNRSNMARCMQVVRLKSKDGSRIIGSLIPQECVDDVLRCLSSPPEMSQSHHDASVDPPTSGQSAWPSRGGHTQRPLKNNGVNHSALSRGWSWPRRPTSVLNRGTHASDRSVFHSTSASFSSPRALHHSIRSRIPHASDPFDRPFNVLNHPPPSLIHRRGTALHSRIGTTATASPLARNSFINGRPEQPLVGSIHSQQRISGNTSAAFRLLPSLQSSAPTNSTSPRMGGVPAARPGSRLNAALSIPIDVPDSSSVEPPAPTPSSVQLHPASFSSSSQPLISSSSSISAAVVSHPLPEQTGLVTSAPLESAPTTVVKRPPSKLTKFKIQWKEG